MSHHCTKILAIHGKYRYAVAIGVKVAFLHAGISCSVPTVSESKGRGRTKSIDEDPGTISALTTLCDGLSMYERISVRAMIVGRPVNVIVDDFPLRMINRGGVGGDRA